MEYFKTGTGTIFVSSWACHWKSRSAASPRRPSPAPIVVVLSARERSAVHRPAPAIHSHAFVSSTLCDSPSHTSCPPSTIEVVWINYSFPRLGLLHCSRLPFSSSSTYSSSSSPSSSSSSSTTSPSSILHHLLRTAGSRSGPASRGARHRAARRGGLRPRGR
jgi:hypothetical protein